PRYSCFSSFTRLSLPCFLIPSLSFRISASLKAHECPLAGAPLSRLRSLRWFECSHGQLSRNLIEIVDLARVGLGFFQAVSYGEELPDDSFSSGPVLPAGSTFFYLN